LGVSSGCGVTQKLTIIIIESRALIRDCLACTLRKADESFVVLTFATAEEWRVAASDYASAVIVICIQGCQPGSIEEKLAQIAKSGRAIPVVIMSDVEQVEHIRSAFTMGARGYIPTSVPLNVAVEAMRLIDAGGTFVPANVLERFHKSEFKQTPPLVDHFTARQAAVLDGLKQGKANKQIAYDLNMREGTVKVHVRNIMKKLNATNRTEVALWVSNNPTKRARVP
jgi:DNA-binding NarL/FixJ family response regulator